MSSLATQTVMWWEVQGDVAIVTFVRREHEGDQTYILKATRRQLQECLRLHAPMAAHPELDFTMQDAAVTTKKLREITLAIPTEPRPVLAVVESLVEADSPRSVWAKVWGAILIVCLLLLSAAFWYGVFCLIERAIR